MPLAVGADEAGTSRGRMTAYAFFVQVPGRVNQTGWSNTFYSLHPISLGRLVERSTNVSILRSLFSSRSSVESAHRDGRQWQTGLSWIIYYLLLTREKLWFNQMADEDKRKVEMETQQVVTTNTISHFLPFCHCPQTLLNRWQKRRKWRGWKTPMHQREPCLASSGFQTRSGQRCRQQTQTSRWNILGCKPHRTVIGSIM